MTEAGTQAMGFTDNSVDLCADSTNYYNSLAIKVIEVLQLIAGSSSIIISILFFVKCQQFFYFHQNSKVLIMLILLTTILHGISISATQSFHLYRYIVAKHSCDLLISNKICYFLRFPAHMSMTIFVYIQVALAVERTVAVLLSKKYEKISSFLGYLLALFTIVLSIPPSYLFLTSWDLNGFTPYCSNVNLYTYSSPDQETFLKDISVDMYIFICYYNTSIDFASFALFLFMRYYNYTILKKRAELDGAQRYQVQENENVFAIVCPEISFHFTFSIIYGVSNLFSLAIHDYCNTRQEFRVYLAAINVREKTNYQLIQTIPYYALLSPLFMWLMLKRSRVQRRTAVIRLTTTKQSEQGGSYFATLEAQWETGVLKKKLPIS